MQLTEANQREKKQTTLTGNKSIHEKLVFIKARVTARTSPLEGIRSSLATVFTEISSEGINDLKILSNRKAGGPKTITSISMIPLKWGHASKCVTCLNNRADLTKRITGNKPRIFKLNITLSSDTDITETVEENPVDMAQGGIIVEVKRLLSYLRYLSTSDTRGH